MNSIYYDDTIAAIATALGNSGIGIVRISGPDAVSVVDKIFKNKNGEHKANTYQTHTLHYGFIYDGENLIDEVMLSIMLSPNSYTREDVFEIQCHGGVLITKKILNTVLKNGARLAEPGEFTKRAFLNGRIDLTKAEAIMDLIQSKSEYALLASVNQLKGNLTNKIADLRDIILYQIAFIESAIDDPEHISLEGYSRKLKDVIQELITSCKKLTSSFQNGKIMREGIETAIIGKPNAGKSSLLNTLLGEEKAIVTDIAGTTRDVLEEYIQLRGISLHLVDTAGIRNTEDIVEKIGVEKAKSYLEKSDLIIYVVDTSVSLDNNDFQIISLLQNKKCIVLCNKSDLNSKVDKDDLKNRLKEVSPSFIRIYDISTKEGSGIEDLEACIEEMFMNQEISFNDQVYITNERHLFCLESCIDSLQMVLNSIENEMPEDFYSIDLMNAYSSLGEIIGEEVGDDLVNEIFSKFCMGK